MATYEVPGIFVEEVTGGVRLIQATSTSIAAFVGNAPYPAAFLNKARPIYNWQEFVNHYASKDTNNGLTYESTPLSQAVYGFFLNGGCMCYVVNVGAEGAPIAGVNRNGRIGLDVLQEVDDISIVAIPGYTSPDDYQNAVNHCKLMKNRIAILDTRKKVSIMEIAAPDKAIPPEKLDDPSAEKTYPLRPPLDDKGYGVCYFPWISVRDPFNGSDQTVAPSGHIAGIWARTDATRGVHKAPANETVRGALELNYTLTDKEQSILYSQGINCLRSFSREGIRVWGARTLAAPNSQWRYVNVRRLFNMIQEAIAVNTRWIVFEPNDRILWKSIRRDISAFLTRLWMDGALMGRTPQEAFFVKCDEETNSAIDEGKVITQIGIAPVKPAEFIIFRISQDAGGVEVNTQELARYN